MKKIIFWLFFIIYSCHLFPYSTLWDFETKVINDGLNDNAIYHISSDDNRFIWIATDRGISRYDGFRFRNYPLTLSCDSLSLPLPQAVKELKKAPDHLFYASLYQGGMIAFDTGKETYLPVHYSRSFRMRNVLDMYVDSNIVYLCTTEGLYRGVTQRIHEKEKEYIKCTLDEHKLIDGRITSICGNNSDLYMIANGRKVVRYNVASKKTTLIKERDKLGRLFYNKGNLWVSLLDNGLLYFDLKKQVERLFSLNSKYLNSVYISSIIPTDDRSYYLTTWSGLFCLKFDSSDLVNSSYSLEPVSQEGSPHSMIENKMTSLLWDDEQKIFWIGTFGGGIVKFVASDEGCSRVEQRLDERISGMAEDEKGYIWLVTTSGNVMRSTSASLSVKTSFALWKKLGELGKQYCLYKDKKGRLWVGGDQGDVLFINPLTEQSTLFSLKLNERKMQTCIFEFCLDSRNRLWLGTDNGLFLADPNTLNCKQVFPKNQKLEGKVYAVAEDKEGNIWIGTEKGLKRIEVMGDEVKLVGNYELKSGLEESAVAKIYVNNYNQIYAAYLNAVIRIDGRYKDKVETVYTLLNGLNAGHIHCMIDDLNGNTWAGNNTGLITIRNGQAAFYNYLSVGNCSSVCRLNDGRLLWANSWDLLFVDPQMVKMNTPKNKLYLTDVEVGGKTIQMGEVRNGQVILTSAPEKQDKLEFITDNRNFRLYFSDLKYGVMKRKIAYRLLPRQEAWSMKQLSEGLSFNQLPVGYYMLEVKLVYPDGSEGQTLRVPIAIKPNWYANIWAYFGYALLVGLLAFLMYKLKMKRNVKRRFHADRETFLKEKLNTERMKREQKQEIDVVRNQMLILFVQEMRTPLSLIIGPLKDLISENSSFETRGRVAYRNALRILDACDQLIGLYGGDSMEGKLKVAPYAAEKLVDNVLFDIRELLKVYTIDFQYEKRIRKDMEFYVDKKKIELVIRNLLSNAFTHTNYVGRVVVSLCETMEDGRNFFTIVVEDDGKIKVDTPCHYLENDKIQSKDLSSVELGYDMMKLIVEMHYGKVAIQSSEENGTKVTISLPVDKEIYDNDENVEFVVPQNICEQALDVAGQAGADMELHSMLRTNVETLVAEETIPAQNVKRKYTLLVVEDQKDIRLYLKVLLGKEYNLLMAANGQEGVDLAKKELPDLIICDVMMPVKDGFECCKELKEDLNTCNIPFIILTAKVEDEDIIKGLELGADDYMLKPFTPSILKAKIQNLIEGRQSLKLMYTKLLKLPGTDAVQDDEEIKDEEDQEDLFIAEVIKIIEENIGEADFSVKKLASDLNMSQPTLYRKVKQSTDYTIIELIRGVRMRRAAVLLKTKHYGVQEVSEMVGYNDIPTFRKHFVDAFGTTPSTYE